MNTATVGKWAFIAGVVLAVLAGLILQASWTLTVLAILGLIVGFLNVSGEETRGFLIAAIALILSATAVQSLPLVGGLLTQILSNLVAFLAAAVLVVALRSLFSTVRE